MRIAALILALLLAFASLAASAPPGAGQDIILGMSAAFSGPTRGLGIELHRGAQAYFSQINAAGGVHGRHIVLRALDDRYSPGPAIENTITLAGQDDVFALFGLVGTPTTTRVLPLLRHYRDKDLYLLFPLTGAEPLRGPPYGQWVFNLRASYFDETHWLVDNFIRQGHQRIAVFHQADAFGRGGWDGVRKALAEYGLRISSEATYQRGASFSSDMQAQVDILKQRDPDAVITIGTSEACAAFIRDARESGLEVPIATLSFANAEHMLLLLLSAGAERSSDLTRDLICSQVVPSYEDLSLPAVVEFRKAMDALAKQPKDPLIPDDYSPSRYSSVAFEGYLNAKLVVECLSRMGPDPSPKLLPSTMESLSALDLGIGETVSFGPDKHQAMSTVFFSTVDQGHLVPLNGFGRWSK